MSLLEDDSINVSKNKLRELQLLLDNIKTEKRKYIESEKVLKHIIIEITQEASSNNHDLVIQKIRDVVLRREILNSLRINDSNEVSLLDINNFLNIELSYEEQKQLKIILEKKLQEKEELLIQDINDISDLRIQDAQEIVEHLKFNSEEEVNKIIDEENKLKELHSELIKSTLALGDKIITLLDLKNDVVPKVMNNKADHLMLEQEKLNLRLKIVEIKSGITLFNNSPMSLQAYSLAYKDMKENQNTYSKEIDSLHSDLEKFKVLLRNKEFEEILQNYKQYVGSIEKLKWLNNEILKKC